MNYFDVYKKRVENDSSSTMQFILFDSDKVDIVEYVEYEDDNGITREAYKIIQKDFICDVNDMDDNKNKATWGYTLEVEKTLICRVNELIKENCLIKYDDVFYKIMKIRKCKNNNIRDFDGFYKIALSKNEEQNINIVESEVDSNE